MSTSGPLVGLRVVEIGNFMAAPFAAMQLADLGADVVKLEDCRTGDSVRSTGPFVEGFSSPFARLNRNKRSVAIDLKADDGKGLLWKLLEGADILIENLRPGALGRLGFDFDTVHRRVPRLIYVSASGWGQDGPLSDLPGLDIMAQARSGLMSITGEPGGDPCKIGVPVCDLVCGLYGALAAVSAVRARDRTGTGQHIDVSLFESGVSLAVWEAGRYFATGEIGGPQGSAHQSNAPYQAIRTTDGWATVGAITGKTWSGLCRALGLTNLEQDPRYTDGYARLQHRDTLIPAIEAVTTQLTTAEVISRLDGEGVPCAPIADMGAALTDEHLTARRFFWDAPHPAMGRVRQLGSPMRLSRTPAVRGGAGPMHGADTRAVLSEVGISEADLDDLQSRGVITTAASTVPVPDGAR